MMGSGPANPAKYWESVARNNFKRIDQLEEALEESVKLQSHYAKILNMYDGGERMEFQTVDEWVDRLDSIKRKDQDNEKIYD